MGVVLHDYAQAKNQVGRFLLDRLPQRGVEVIEVSYADLVRGAVLDPAKVPILILPESAFFPAASAEALHRYLGAGGQLIALGGDPFARPLVYNEEIWRSLPEFAAQAVAAPQSPAIVDPEKIAASAWKAERKNRTSNSSVTIVTEPERKAFLFEHRDVQKSDGFFLAVEGLSPAWDALVFEARADENTPQSVLQVRTRDGLLYETVLELRPQWQPLLVPLRNFKGIGKAVGKPLSAADVAQIGFTMTMVRHFPGDHDIWVGPLYGLTLPKGILNQIETGSFVLGDDRDAYRFSEITATTSCPGAPIEGFSKSGTFSGVSALGFPLWGESRFIPLLEAYDRYERRRGWAGGLIVNDGGRWKGSKWAIFGIEETEWYLDEGFVDYVVRLGPLMTQKLPAATGQKKDRSKERSVSSPLPRISIKDGVFVYPDGKPFFAIGQNLAGNLYDRSLAKHDGPSIDTMFRMLHDAGVNALRIQNINPFIEGNTLDLLCETAERYGVYLLVGTTPLPKEKFNTKKDLQNYARQLAGYFKNKSVLLGYDLMNEPYVHEIAAYKDDSGRTLGEVYHFNRNGFEKFSDALPVVPGHNAVQFSGLTSILSEPKDQELAATFKAVDGIYGDWISWFKEAFIKAGDTHPISVGYNMWYAALPCNQQLDYISHHVYVMPTSYDCVMEQLTSLDRLHRFFPEKPVTFGEYGYPNGYILKGKPLSDQGQAVGELLHILYPWAKGYSGAFDWEVFDFDPVLFPLIASAKKNEWPFKVGYERLHGIYTWDGTEEGILKPAGTATRFFAEAVAAGMDRGNIVVTEADTQIDAGFVYKASNALFIGGLNHTDSLLTFSSPEELVLGLYWTAAQAVVQSTADVTVTLGGDEMARLGLPIEAIAVTGKNGGWKTHGDVLEVNLLAGEKITIRAIVSEKP